MSNKQNNHIVERTYYEIAIKAISPISVGNGTNLNTDADVMRNAQGECFIPGSSLAGAFRNYFNNQKNVKSIFGFTEGELGQMSPTLISDLYFDKTDVKVSVRDRVSLDADKGVNNKFDVEIVEPGTTGNIKIETIKRLGDEFDFDDSIARLIHALQIGDIRLGANKNRGFGRIEIESIRQSKFDKNNREEWIKYLAGEESAAGRVQSYKEWASDVKHHFEGDINRYSIQRINLTLNGGISIRRYSAEPGKADYEHITSNGEPIIPGTSWSGAIRSAAVQILQGLEVKGERLRNLIDTWFGKVGEKEGDSRQSMIVISESVIRGAKPVKMTRNSINRFTAGTKDGALYTEISYFGGKTTLEYMIQKNAPDMMDKALQALMQLIVTDICNGIVSVGGQVAVGRGVFSGNPKDIVVEEESRQALYDVIVKEASHENR